MFSPGIDTNVTIAIKLLVSAVLGIIIGFDREKSGKPAGIRTQMLVCVGSALLSSISIDLVVLVDDTNAATSIYRIDPARVMAQIVSGIGFLGAGVILKNGNKIQGVTTAATIWMTAAIGIAIGAGFYVPAMISTTLVLLLNPLARLQYKYGLKGTLYVAKTAFKHQPLLEKLFEKNTIDIRQRGVKGRFITFVINSSNQKNEKVINELRKRRVPFDLQVFVD
jgi:putative Mg2+ transporter-C (MgtC) family protein